MTNPAPKTFYRVSNEVDALFYNGSNADDIGDFAELDTSPDWLTGGIYLGRHRFPSIFVAPRTWVVKGWDGDIQVYTTGHFGREFTDRPVS